MTGFVNNGGGHVPVGRGQQVPARLPIRMQLSPASARRVPTPTRVVHNPFYGSGVSAKRLVGVQAAHCADRGGAVEVRQVPGTNLAVATKKTANQSTRIYESARRL